MNETKKNTTKTTHLYTLYITIKTLETPTVTHFPLKKKKITVQKETGVHLLEQRCHGYYIADHGYTILPSCYVACGNNVMRKLAML